MTAQQLLLHPVARLARLILNLGLAVYFFWQLWSGGNAGYLTLTAFLILVVWNFAAGRAKRQPVSDSQ